MIQIPRFSGPLTEANLHNQLNKMVALINQALGANPPFGEATAGVPVEEAPPVNPILVPNLDNINDGSTYLRLIGVVDGQATTPSYEPGSISNQPSSASASSATIVKGSASSIVSLSHSAYSAAALLLLGGFCNISNSTGSADYMNLWVNDATKARISTMVHRQYSPATGAAAAYSVCGIYPPGDTLAHTYTLTVSADVNGGEVVSAGALIFLIEIKA